MDLVTLIQNIRDLIAAIRAGDYLAALLLAIEIMKAIDGTIPKKAIGKLRATPHGAVALEQLDEGELADKLEEACNDEMHGGLMAATPATGPFIDKVLPILLLLLKRWLGI